MNVVKSIQCPYCDSKNTVRYNTNEPSRFFVTCDLGDGGCNQEFAVQALVTVQLTPYAVTWAKPVAKEK